MKKILFVINTMGRAGAEQALLNCIKRIDEREYEISLFVLMGQGEMMKEIPPYVRIRNTSFNTESVLSKSGRRKLTETVLKAFFRNGGGIRKIGHVAENIAGMIKQGRFQADKALWRLIADGAPRMEENFDLAVAWLEGGSAYYVSDWVRAEKKAAFIHIDYERSGYTRAMDRNCWKCYDKIFAVSHGVKEKFLAVYPEFADRMGIFQNIIDQEYIRYRAGERGGFADGYEGMRILTVGRLTYQKGLDISIEAMKILKDAGYPVRWYVLGEGSQRESLEKKIASLGLTEDFLLLGAMENPYPYYLQADLYVHASRFEGQSIAVREAQILGCAVIVSDCCGSRELIEDGKYGVSCVLTPGGIADSIKELLSDNEKREKLGQTAAAKKVSGGQERLFDGLLAEDGNEQNEPEEA